MVHLNIRSIPEHFIELTHFDSLDFVFKIIAISEILTMYNLVYNNNNIYLKSNIQCT